MALIVEDGTLVANANSYVNLTVARAYALARGVTLSADDTIADVLAIKAMDYIEVERARFKGTLVDSTQALQWPRQDVTIDGFLLAITAMPQTLLDAQCQAMMDTAVLDDLSPIGTGKEVLEEKVDVIQVKYAERGSSAPQPVLVKTENLLAPLYKTTSALPVTRI